MLGERGRRTRGESSSSTNEPSNRQELLNQILESLLTEGAEELPPPSPWCEEAEAEPAPTGGALEGEEALASVEPPEPSTPLSQKS